MVPAQGVSSPHTSVVRVHLQMLLDHGVLFGLMRFKTSARVEMLGSFLHSLGHTGVDGRGD